MKSQTYYVVHFTTCVDAPERRDATYPVVARDCLIPQQDSYDNFRGAVGMYKSIINGEYDYASEYVTRVWVQRHTIAGTSQRCACVRRTVLRDRANPDATPTATQGY